MNISNKIFFIILIYEFNFIYYLHAASTTNSIKPSSKRPIGICVANQTTSTPVTYWETKYEKQLQNYTCSDGSGNVCSKHVMVPIKVLQSKNVKGFKLVNVCCKGYKKMGKKCEPRCHPECEHGKCIKPDTCKCDRGYKVLTDSKCTPDCQNCQNGYCLTPTECKCYSLYQKGDNGTCVPRCDPKCVNGDCVSPDTCTCHTGYEADILKNYTCNPICQVPCGDGGRCVAPNVCECSSVYRLNATQQCEPICDNCDNGVCIKPGECVCNENYESKTVYVGHKAETRCSPICQMPCGDGGRCISPNVCECSSGYRLNATQQCEPICGSCDNGVCIKPEECVCNENYESKTVSVGHKPEVRCAPICQIPCGDGGHCIAPNVCECSFNYRLNATQQCEPICESCDNGVCVKPGECVCNENYESKTIFVRHKLEMRCKPVCQVPCGDGGHCIAPNACHCSAGYQLNATQQCEPICESCDNGVCVKPEECVCNTNYQSKTVFAGHKPEMRCEPICQVPCGDGGYCIAPNTCECSSGYQLNATQQCEPICDNCDNGACIKPDECVCNENFERKTVFVGHRSEMRCEPVCHVPCGDGGHCIAPNTCECNSGYRLNGTQQCEPICEICDNGVCIKPGECVCNENYESKQKIVTRCDPICTNSCVNGFCSDVNECTCNEGYERNKNLTHVCNRICDPPCVNGRCTVENKCECLPGYLEHLFKDHVCVDCNYTCTESEDCALPEGCPCPDSEEFNIETFTCGRAPITAAPECSGVCTNSNCTYGQCICYDGYNKFDADSNNCFPLCNNNLNGCTNGVCIAPDVCDCSVGYTLSRHLQFECILAEKPKTTIPTITQPAATSPSSSTTEFVERSDNILDQPLNQVPDTECTKGDCHNEMERIQEGDMPQLFKAHYNYILIVIGVAVLSVIIILTMIYRKYNRTKTFKTHEQEAFLSSPYFIGGPIKTSCDIELEES